MNAQKEPLVYEKHKNLRVKRSSSFDHKKDSQFIPLLADEFSYASTCFPIMFIKDKRTGRFFPIALLGLEKDENLFYSPAIWSVPYIPKMMCLEPFSIGVISSGDAVKRWGLFIDRSSAVLSFDEGERLYDGNVETQFLIDARRTLVEVEESKRETELFIDSILEKKLIKAAKIKMDFSDAESQLIDGVYIIDAKKVKKLTAPELKELNENGSLSKIYAALSSEYNFYELIKRKKIHSGKPATELKSLQVLSD